MKPMKPMSPMKPMEFSAGLQWWPEEFGHPNSTGGQNDVQYAYFRSAHRLLLRHADQTTTYDTDDHVIQGVSQVSDTDHATFITDRGELHLSQLKRV